MYLFIYLFIVIKFENTYIQNTSSPTGGAVTGADLRLILL